MAKNVINMKTNEELSGQNEELMKKREAELNK